MGCRMKSVSDIQDWVSFQIGLYNMYLTEPNRISVTRNSIITTRRRVFKYVTEISEGIYYEYHGITMMKFYTHDMQVLVKLMADINYLLGLMEHIKSTLKD